MSDYFEMTNDLLEPRLAYLSSPEPPQILLSINVDGKPVIRFALRENQLKNIVRDGVQLLLQEPKL